MLAVIAAHVTEVLWIAPDRARVAVVGELLETATARQRLPQVLVGVDVRHARVVSNKVLANRSDELVGERAQPPLGIIWVPRVRQ